MPESLGGPFRRLWTASTLSNLGDGLEVAALPLLAASLTRDPAVFAGVTVASRLPWLLFSLPAGSLADRFDRRRLMVWGDVIRGTLIAALAAAVAADVTSVWLLYAVALAMGVLETVVDVSAQAFLPSIVPAAGLERANGRLISASIIANELAGPPLGAVMFTAWAAAPFLFDGISFFAAAVLVASIPWRSAPHHFPESAPDRRVTDGLRWLFAHDVLRGLALVGGAMNAAWMAATAVLALFALETLALSETGFGLLLASAATGAVVGGVLAEQLVQRISRGVALLGAAVSHGLVFLAIGAAASVPVTALALAWMGFTSAMWNVVAVSLRQLIVPNELLGRVGAAYRFVQWGLMPIGALVGGLIADVYGLRAPWIMGGTVVLLVSGSVGTRTLRTARVEAARETAVTAVGHRRATDDPSATRSNPDA